MWLFHILGDTRFFVKALTSSADLSFVPPLVPVPRLWVVPQCVVVPQNVVVPQMVVVQNLGRHLFFSKARTSISDLSFDPHLCAVPHIVLPLISTLITVL